MKVALITTCQHPCASTTGWGAESYIWSLCEELCNLGHDVSLFAKEGSQIPQNGRLIVCKNEDIILPQYSYLFDYFDIIHDFSATKQIHDYCQKRGFKSLATNFNTHFLYPEIHKNIVCLSESQKQLGLKGMSGFEGTPWESIVGYTGQLKCDAEVIPIGIDLNLYKPKYDKEDYILYFNSWDWFKGLKVVFDLVEKLGFKLKLAGSTIHPEHKKNFEYLKPIMDKMPNVSYETDVTNERKIELMQNAKALLFPSLFHQPFAVVVVEALACGTPIITTSMGAMPEIVKHGETGFVCSTMEELTQSINNISNINNMECRNDVEKRFNRKLMAERYLKLYKKILKGEKNV